MVNKFDARRLFSLFGLMLIALPACTPIPSEADSELSETEEIHVTPTQQDEVISSATATPLGIPYSTPEWFNEAVIYEIFVRSFRDSDNDGTGDLAGVTESLDYIQELGANTIWLMPIYPTPSQHGYDVEDFFAVNPEYGTLEDLQVLVSAAHDSGMRVILDFVPSHLSNQNPIFSEAYGNPSSALSEWFVWTNDKHTLYASFAGNEQMPRFNHYNPEVVDYLIEAALFWLDLDGDGEYQDGIDGFRVDNAKFPPQEFIKSLRQGIKSANPDALLLGESWTINPSDLGIFFTDQFDALFDFPMYEMLQGNQNFNGDGLLAGDGIPALLNSLLREKEKNYPPEGFPVGFLSNHDTNRIATEVRGDPQRMRMAISFLAAMPDPMMVYYGEEIGMLGHKGGPPAYDNYRREPMDWFADQEGDGQATWFRPEDRLNIPNDGISVEEQDSDANSLLNQYRFLLGLRKDQPALNGGEFEIVSFETSGVGPWGFLRSSDEQSILAVYNFGIEEQEIIFSEFPFHAEELTDLISGDKYPAPTPGEQYQLKLPPAAAIWLTALD